MAITDLVFKSPPVVGQPVQLVFGATETPEIVNATVSAVGTLPGLTNSVRVTIAVKVAAAGVLPGVTGSFQVVYRSDTSRPTVSQTLTDWQVSSPLETGSLDVFQRTLRLPKGTEAIWQMGANADKCSSTFFANADRLARQVLVAHDNGTRLQDMFSAQHQEANRAVRKMLEFAYEEAERLQTKTSVVKHQDGLRDRRKSAAAGWQVADAYSFSRASVMGRATQLLYGDRVRWQNAMQPGIGQLVVIPPLPERCYTPDPNLLFSELWSNNLNLLFKCDRVVITPPIPGETVVVPVQRVYVVLNNASLRRVDGNLLLATFGMSLSLDVGSWTWQFSASLPAQELSKIEPSMAGDPVVVEALINGTAYQMLVESISRERVFGQASIRVSGRGIAATLDAPYAPVTSFTNSAVRTAQQLMGDVLTLNGVSLGWTVNWGLTDWSVPAGIFNHQGSYISALNTIAGAAGGYLQPANVGKTLHVLPRYKAAPWKWATDIVPDFSLPADVAVREAIEWVERARYNRVYVSGESAGVLGQVTIDQTDGALAAPMVVDALITHADAARQRGTSVLSDTGRIANISLRLPVLASTNIIVPGKYIDFVDGAVTRRGVVRSTQVEVGMPEIWQTIGVETHA